jgi:hypothetical protein
MNTIIVCQKNEQQITSKSAFSGKHSALSENKDFMQRNNQKSCVFLTLIADCCQL